VAVITWQLQPLLQIPLKKMTDSFNVSDDPLLVISQQKDKLPKNYSITLKKFKKMAKSRLLNHVIGI